MEEPTTADCMKEFSDMSLSLYKESLEGPNFWTDRYSTRINTKIDFREIRYEGVNWIHLAQDRV
jgi:hypothetical protein